MRLLCVVLLLAAVGWGQGTGDFVCTQRTGYGWRQMLDEYCLPAVTRHPTLPLPEPELLASAVFPTGMPVFVLPPCSLLAPEVTVVHWEPPAPMVVPAIHHEVILVNDWWDCPADTQIGIYGGGGYGCIPNREWSCVDLSQVRLVSEDGKQAWCAKF